MGPQSPVRFEATSRGSLGAFPWPTGRLREQFETKLQRQPLDEWLRKLREEEPPRPSTKVIADRETSTATAEARGTEPKQLVSTLRGDLDCITMKALEKDRARRYGAPSELAADIRRYLSHEPVVARPASAAYRSSKFIKRHKLALSVAAVFVLVLLAGIVAIVREARIARMQEARAEKRFETLRKLTNSLLFEFHDSIEKLPGSTQARELVVSRALEYLEQIEAEAPKDPATLRDLAAAYERIGRIRGEERQPHLGGLGSHDQARQLLEKALAIRQRLADTNPNDLTLQLERLETMTELGTVRWGLGDRDPSLTEQRLKIEEQLVASHDSEDLRLDMAQAMISLGVLKVDSGDYQSAADYERRAVAMNQALLDANPTSFRILRRVAISHDWLATALMGEGKYADADSEFLSAIAIVQQLLVRDPNNAGLQRMISNYNDDLCRSLGYLGFLTEAQRHCQIAIAMNESRVKSDKNDVQAEVDLAGTNGNMGLILYLMHSPQAALVFERRAGSLYHETTERDPEDSANGPGYAISLIYAGRIEADLHRPDLARRDLERAQKILEALMRGPNGREVQERLDEVRAVIKALPHDTVPIVPY